MSSAREGWMADLRVTSLQATLVPTAPWSRTERPEVTVRGALGAALYDVVCVRADRACDRCALVADCLIPSWFEPGRNGQQARPYVIRIDGPRQVTADRPLRVQMDWFGRIPRPTALLEALIRAAGKGLGPDRVRHQVQKVRAVGVGAPVIVVERDEVVGRWPEPDTLLRRVRLPVREVSGATVILRTPAQISSDGKPTAKDVLKAAILRLRALERAQGVTSVRRWPEPSVHGEWLDLRWVGGSRYSRRSRGPHDLSGWRGVLEVGPEIGPYVDLLAASEVVHLGRGSSAGLGRVEVRWRQ